MAGGGMYIYNFDHAMKLIREKHLFRRPVYITSLRPD